MSTIYKVWVEIEEIDHEADHYTNVGEPIDVAVFESYEAAEAFQNELEQAAVALLNPVTDEERSNGPKRS